MTGLTGLGTKRNAPLQIEKCIKIIQFYPRPPPLLPQPQCLLSLSLSTDGSSSPSSRNSQRSGGKNSSTGKSGSNSRTSSSVIALLFTTQTHVGQTGRTDCHRLRLTHIDHIALSLSNGLVVQIRNHYNLSFNNQSMTFTCFIPL